MASRASPRGSNQPPKVIVKKVMVEAHGGHHGGAWKVAYADFVTAMMVFFLLLWLLGATTEKQRKALADYFTPTLIDYRENSAGSNGLLGGSSLLDKDNYPHKAAQLGTRAMSVPIGADGGNDAGTGEKGVIKSAREVVEAEDRRNFEKLKAEVTAQMQTNRAFTRLRKNIRFVPTRDGLRIDLIDDADFSMFALGTTALEPAAAALIDTIAKSVAPMGNQLSVRGHTDNVPYGDPGTMNNWMLSSGRAEATRRKLNADGVVDRRFDRIEGVADREPFIAANPADPRNRRVSITLLYRRGAR